jgi:hypothetical protein
VDHLLRMLWTGVLSSSGIAYRRGGCSRYTDNGAEANISPREKGFRCPEAGGRLCFDRYRTREDDGIGSEVVWRPPDSFAHRDFGKMKTISGKLNVLRHHNITLRFRTKMAIGFLKDLLMA